MDLGGRRLLICNCEETMPLDAKALEKALRAAGATGALALNRQLCRAQLANFQAALEGGEPLLVACTQEAPLFGEVAAEHASDGQAGDDAPDVAFTNIRERAGWSAEAKDARPKIAALIAEAAVAIPPAGLVSMTSQGICLVYGRDEQAIAVAKQLAGRLDVTVLLTEPGDILPPAVMDVPVFKGTIVQAKGHLGGFGISVKGYAPAVPSARGTLRFEAPRDDAFSECDLILDLTGDAPLFPAHTKRDGYLKPDPRDPVAVQKALFDLVDLVGEFQKPRYVRYDAEICAHGRNRKTGCTRCLDVCPAAAIQPAGDEVVYDPYLCGGCGGCASVCPTGAVSYQVPPAETVLERLRTLLGTYRKAGGEAPVLLLHDGRHGDAMIDLMARAGRGLPANVLPFPLNEVTQVGLDVLAGAFAYGAAALRVLPDPKRRDELGGLAAQIGLAETVMEGLGYGGGRIHLLDETDPEALEAQLYALETQAPPAAGSFLPMGGKRARTLLGLRHLHEHAPRPADLLPLPAGAPFGAVNVDAEGCTLCLACVSACPTGALLDDAERPWLGFNEEACIQCGICRVTCPESVITLEPRLNFTEEARGQVTKNEEEPFPCIRCGKLFGVKSTIERITAQLAGKHAMFAAEDQIARIKMCDDCRVAVQFDAGDAPFRAGPRPTPRTTDDDLRERELEKARAMARAKGVDPGTKH